MDSGDSKPISDVVLNSNWKKWNNQRNGYHGKDSHEYMTKYTQDDFRFILKKVLNQLLNILHL